MMISLKAYECVKIEKVLDLMNFFLVKLQNRPVGLIGDSLHLQS